MVKSIYVLLLCLLSGIGFSQTLTTAEESDPAAKKILDKLKAEYDSYKSMEVAFELVLELPHQEVETQNGLVIQQDEKYKLKLDQRTLISDGKIVWHYIKKNNELQITDVEGDEETAMMSPKDMMKLYESGEFVYFITAEPLVDGKKTTQIDFKPLDRNSDFSKMSLFVDKKSQKMAQMKVFSKDGGRYTLKIHDITANKTYTPDTFIFDISKFPEIHVEDLRID